MPDSRSPPSPPGVLPLEIGALSASSPSETRFFGSSSGVFFINTVLRAFADVPINAPPLSGNTEQNTEPPDGNSVNDCLAEPSEDTDIPADPARRLGLDDSTILYTTATTATTSYGRIHPGLGRLPEATIAKKLVMTYFEIWHPLFPFLHGPSFLNQLEDLYTDGSIVSGQCDLKTIDNTCQAVLFQSVFNLAAADRPDIGLSPESRIKSKSTLMSILGVLATRNETQFIQAILAAQIYLIASMSLNAASTVGGMLLRKIFQAGFHRCPYRYIQLSQHDCEMRKRIFWCVYAIDRYLSQALGHPLGFQDRDADVCMPGNKELHTPVPRVTQATENSSPGREVLLHLPDGHPAHPDLTNPSGRSKSRTHQNRQHPTSGVGPFQIQSEQSTVASHKKGDKILASYVGYGKIVGRALELFHTSIHNRTVGNNDILLLNSEIHSWWNQLPSDIQELCPPSGNDLNETEFSFSPFFNVMYQQLILFVNRPFLSSDPSTPHFQSSLQICIGASRKIISTFQDYPQRTRCFSAPGILSGIWMSGLVIAFACELDVYPVSKGFLEIEVCLRLLESMSKRWNNVRHCRNILEILLSNLQKGSSHSESFHQRASSTSQLHSISQSSLQRPRPGLASDYQESGKRQRTGVSTLDIVNTSDSWNTANQFPNPHPSMTFDGTGETLFETNELQPDLFAHISWEALFRGGDLQANEGSDTSFAWNA
ncbi:fungal-specific transcription factor domain-containing protein [Bisporella sp. PMI_857]|nr:fungal-specific transcription factor domain-containing protein [Bisporella sp. PMI_857]